MGLALLARLCERGFSPIGSSVLAEKNLRLTLSSTLTLSQPPLLSCASFFLFCSPSDL